MNTIYSLQQSTQACVDLELDDAKLCKIIGGITDKRVAGIFRITQFLGGIVIEDGVG